MRICYDNGIIRLEGVKSEYEQEEIIENFIHQFLEIMEYKAREVVIKTEGEKKKISFDEWERRIHLKCTYEGECRAKDRNGVCTLGDVCIKQEGYPL